SSGEDELLDHVCRIAVEEGGYRFAWIGYAQRDRAHTVRPVASHGVDEGYLDAVEITWSDGELGRGPTGTAIRTGEPSLAREIAEESGYTPWREEALERRYRSSVAIPLLTDGECLGALNIYSGETDAFDDLEIEVLRDLGTALAQGITLHRARRREDELHSRLQGAENLRALGQLATGVAHDFNNYLTVITSVADLLLADTDLDERHRADIREIREAADQSALLTSQLLAFGRKHPTRLEVVDPNRAVRDTASMLDRILGEKIAVEMSLDPEIGPIRVDPVQLEQALMNLVLNARDAMPDGGTLKIRTAVEEVGEDLASRYQSVEAGPHVLLQITDSGMGMDPETRARLFEPFFTKKEEGTGLGLSMVYGSVKQCGGSIWVDSEPGQGTTFRIYLPLAEVVGEERRPGRAGPSTGPLHGSETILLVEDQAAVRRATRRILERYGYEVIEASTVAEAREAIRSPDPPLDLVVTDMKLPDGSGRDVAEALLGAGSAVPVLFTSGVAPEDLDAGPTFEATDHYIEKPFDPDGLARAVRAALSRPDAGLGEAS
nr:GAF domain-containing protein [Gemmatimonadota bacterium]NIR76997.1 GAF domain-containing protein [Gemmatimonadota bacterium]NIT88920.1 GAF domain-containing protein [Gemmatimonadota bacterium]NIU29352.1 GAF domain-containing protein [Gemmatimonadota bacterium]NIU34412.1 GAF domain-containing protein [Gemmatimonadota bacterium]